MLVLTESLRPFSATQGTDRWLIGRGDLGPPLSSNCPQRYYLGYFFCTKSKKNNLSAPRRTRTSSEPCLATGNLSKELIVKLTIS